MATKIRLARFGRKKRPFYRIMVSDSRAPRDGRHIDSIGYYNPLTSPKDIKIEKEKALNWLNRGAIPSPTVRSLLSGQGILLEWELRKQGKSEKIIGEELQKFAFLQDLKQKKKDEKRALKSEAKEAAAEAEVAESQETVPAETEAEASLETQPAESEAVSDTSVVAEDVKTEKSSGKKPDDEVLEPESSETQDENQSEPTEKAE